MKIFFFNTRLLRCTSTSCGSLLEHSRVGQYVSDFFPTFCSLLYRFLFLNCLYNKTFLKNARALTQSSSACATGLRWSRHSSSVGSTIVNDCGVHKKPLSNGGNYIFKQNRITRSERSDGDAPDLSGE